jgi:FdhD protein
MDDPQAHVRRTVTPTRVLAVRSERHLEVPDQLATEEPMEIRVAGPGQEPQPIAVTMRTPGHDFELAVGFLRTEGLIHRSVDVASVRYCAMPPGEEQHFNIVTVDLRGPAPETTERTRNFTINSSCGVCGKATLDQVELECPIIGPGPTVPGSLIPSLPHRLRQAQRLFDQTGGLHAAGVFDGNGELMWLREDVGRHNAVDKVVGHAFLADRLPLSQMILHVSGRVSFEIVQKAAMAGVPVVAAVSAPSSLAVEAAERLGLTVVGFVRDATFNVYTHPERIDLDAP